MFYSLATAEVTLRLWLGITVCLHVYLYLQVCWRKTKTMKDKDKAMQSHQHSEYIFPTLQFSMLNLSQSMDIHKIKQDLRSAARKWIAFILSLDTLSNFHSSIYLSGRAFMCHFLLSLETSVENGSTVAFPLVLSLLSKTWRNKWTN